ncbi:MAG: heme-binding protein [Dehalococcoidia bacterium]|nr:heme-binding protein [Dehalococcoidia bacterium]
MAITLSEAQKIMRAAQASAKALGINVSISVVDPRGDLVASVRMDGARFFTPDVARGKAMVSAMFGQASAALAERASDPIFQGLNQMQQGRLMFGQGAVPITKGSEIVGAVGVSGGTAQQDEDVAKAGLAAL